ncbi:MAG TPA: ABC transporter permease [Streptosporangiaceae bacterium]|nr:ABC transporter permease [Streptosporangiaceae bacterium]
MLRFLLRRIIQGIIVLWLITIGVFLIFYVGPGPKAVPRALAGKNATPQTLQEVTHRLLLDRPIYVQYDHFVWLLLHGNLGFSFYHGQSVNSVLKAAFPITLSLVIGAAIIWIVLGVLSGVLSAVKSRSIADRVFTGLALFFYSMPTFVLGLLLLLLLYYELTIHGIHAFPPTYIPFGQSSTGWFRSLILPWVTLALVSAATYTRLTRGSMLDVMNEDYIRTARAKGLSERRVIFRHSLRAALTPIVTQFGLDVGILLGGAVITEQVFSMPGLGFTAVQAITQQDLPVVIGVVIVASAAVVVANIVVDAFYAVLDPRVRLH